MGMMSRELKSSERTGAVCRRHDIDTVAVWLPFSRHQAASRQRSGSAEWENRQRIGRERKRIGERVACVEA